MVRIISLAAALLLFAEVASSGTLKLYGSAGAESQRTPASQSSPLNAGNVAAIAGQTNLADLVWLADYAPHSRAWKLHVKLRGEATDQGGDTAEVGEAFLQLQLHDAVDVTVGRVIEKWGTGYGWTPTSFVGPMKHPTDPNDRRSLYRGADMIRADLFVKKTNVSLYAVANGAAAARVYRLVRGTDVSLLFHRHAGATRSGVSLSRVFGDALELHAEVAHSDEGGGATRALFGGQYTWRDTNFVVELYHAGDGMSAGEWQAFRSSVTTALQSRDGEALRLANRAYAPLKMGTTYAFTRVARSFSAARTELELIAIAGLRDGSMIARAAVTHRLHPNVALYLMDTEFVGRGGSEISYVQVERVTTAGVRVYF